MSAAMIGCTKRRRPARNPTDHLDLTLNTNNQTPLAIAPNLNSTQDHSTIDLNTSMSNFNNTNNRT